MLSSRSRSLSFSFVNSRKNNSFAKMLSSWTMIHLEKTYVSWFFNTIVKKLFLEMIYYYSMLLDIIIKLPNFKTTFASFYTYNCIIYQTITNTWRWPSLKPIIILLISSLKIPNIPEQSKIKKPWINFSKIIRPAMVPAVYFHNGF